VCGRRAGRGKRTSPTSAPSLNGVRCPLPPRPGARLGGGAIHRVRGARNYISTTLLSGPSCKRTPPGALGPRPPENNKKRPALRAANPSAPSPLSPPNSQESTIGAAFLTKAMPEHGVKFEIVSLMV